MGPTGPQQVLQGAPLLERIGLGIGAFGDYVGKSLWPHPLLNEYDDPTGGIPAGSVAWVILFAGALAWWVHRKNTRGVWALALFAIPLGPVLNIAYRTGETFAERFLALPVAGICLALTLIASMRPRIGSFILTGLVIAFLALTVKRAGDYQSDEALMEALVRDAPHQASSYRLLAGVPMRNWDTAIKLGNEVEAREHARQAIELFEKAVAANPRDFMARLDLARFLATLGAPKIAGGAANTEWLLESQRLAASVAAERPKLHEAHKILGQALAGHGVASAGPERARLLAEAETSLREAIALEPRETQAAQSLMRILDHLKRPAEAIDVARTMLGRLRELGDRRWWDPSLLLHQAAVLRSLATLERDPKHIVAALDAYAEARRRAIRAPVIADTADRWAFTLRELRRPLEADQILDEAVRVIETFVGTLRPQADVLAALGELEARRGRLPEAMAWFEKAAQAASRAEIAHGWRERARELRDNAGRPR
jgi:tetratricopeptide (TPR) repeat protein